MRNRAKCKKCESILESFHKHDYVTCKCGEISIDGGLEYYKASAIDFNNFLRIDDQGNEIIVSLLDKEPEEPHQQLSKDESNPSKPKRADLLKMLDEMIKSYENLPPNAMYSHPTQFDLYSALLLISSLLKVED